MMHFMNDFVGIGMFVWMFLQWGLLLAGIYLLFRWISGDKDKAEDSALHILRDRLAKGEISEEEFIHKKNKLV